MINNSGSTPPPEVQQARKLFLRAFGRLFALGAAGIAAAAPFLIDTLRHAASAGGGSAATTDVIASIAQLVVLTGIWIAVGTALAPRLRLRSHIVAAAWNVPLGGDSFRRELASAIPAGIGTAALIILLDFVWRPFLGSAGNALAGAAGRTIANSLAGLLYGGLTEELMMRWGVMSLVAWLGWRFVQKGKGRLHPLVVWPSIVLAALIFGLAHLGAVAAVATPTAGVVVRTVVLNAIAGTAFGWLFWKKSLESAMTAHAIFHIVVAMIAWSGMAPAAL